MSDRAVLHLARVLTRIIQMYFICERHVRPMLLMACFLFLFFTQNATAKQKVAKTPNKS